MKLHSNAKLTPKGRLALAQAVKEGRLTLNAAAAAFKLMRPSLTACASANRPFGVNFALLCSFT